MNYGLTKEQYDYIYKNVVAPLEELGASIWCYGSRARGTYNKFSDLDLMVESEKDLSAQIEQMKEKLSNSNFPYKVDLVQLRDFAESYKPGYYQDKKKF